MGTPSARKAVYWGAAPYPKGHEGFEPYHEWQQAQARDLGESDFRGILAAARDWLKTPVLAENVEGMPKDAQLRAALDLAIRDHAEGKYSVGLHPTVYNDLLSRLASSSNEELLTIRVLLRQAGNKQSTHQNLAQLGHKLAVILGPNSGLKEQREAGRVAWDALGNPQHELTETQYGQIGYTIAYALGPNPGLAETNAAGEAARKAVEKIMGTSNKQAGWDYAVARACYLFVQGRRLVPFNNDVIHAINGVFVPVKDSEGEDHDDGKVRVLDMRVSEPLTHIQEKSGFRQEMWFMVEIPKGSDRDVAKALQEVGKKFGYKLELSQAGYYPHTRVPPGRNTLASGLGSIYATDKKRTTHMMPKFAKEDADRILARLDRMAATIQQRYASWGMPFEEAKKLVNAVDATADELEVACFGADSLQSRQAEIITKTAEVLQRESDEKYMTAFDNPMAPIQTEADEPYMRAYGAPDQSSAVRHGESTTGRPLVP